MRVASREDILDCRAVVPADVVYREFGDETLLLNLSTGNYHGVNASGARLIALLPETDGDLRLAVERLAAECGVGAGEIAEEMAGFCVQLAERGLLEATAR
jgi:hypothetical protein